MAFNFTDPTLTTEIKLKKVHISELVDNLKAIRDNKKVKLTSQVSIDGINYNKVNSKNLKILQNALNALETKFSNNCCQANCCQTYSQCNKTTKAVGTSCQKQCNITECYSYYQYRRSGWIKR